MRTMFCLGTSVVVTITLSALAFAEEQSPNIQDDHRKAKIGEFVAEVPKVIQKDFYEKAVQFALKVYPGIDEKVLREKCAQGFMRDRYLLRAIRKHPKVSCRGCPSLELSFPNGDKMELRAKNAPPGVTLEKLEKPLELKDAEQLARQVLSRLLPSPKDVARFTLARSGKGPLDYYYFDWREVKSQPLRKAGKRVYIWVRLNDGLISYVSVREALPAPKIRFEDIAKTAAKAIPGFRRKHLYLFRWFEAGKGTLVWCYERPRGMVTKDTTAWDATTGELLYSVVLNGGKPDKPYRNPPFYTELTEEIKTGNVEALIKRRVAELQE